LRVPGSFVDTLPGNTGQVGDRFQRGSGTSEATAVVAGVAALVLQEYPNAGPDQVKGLINGTATALSSGNANAPGQRVHWGYGIVNGFAATLAAPQPAVQTGKTSAGSGSLDATRGGVTVTDGATALTGQQDIFGQPFNATAMAGQQSAAAAWTGGIWNGTRWTGDGWAPDASWTGSHWRGNDWAGGPWTGSHWRDQRWDGSHWRGTGWGGSQWTGTAWDDAIWASYAWN
jgi:serine protease AprX